MTSHSTHPDPSETDAGDGMAVTLASDAAATLSRESGTARPGREFGRYVVLERLGAGAMGIVLAAYDPELDRKLALKLLHPHDHSRGAPEGHLRLLAEAQALARLSHPNVVTVHDVGTHEGQVFVAMEFVQGQTLGQWLAQRRPWDEVLDVMLSAGRGLAAAHARDLVHRDFKPDNVMLGDDGRVRVMDFGLARADPDASLSGGSPSMDPASVELEVSQPRHRALDLQLTHAGTLVGTPAYMPPEIIDGRRGGPAADQFSYCVTSWEGLYGQRPFIGESIPELYTEILDGRITRPPASARVPGWLRHVLERGLSVAPEHRWPSMQALLDALERGRTRARQRRWLGGAAMVGAIAAGGWGVQRYQAQQQRRACEVAGASIEGVWNDEVAATLREAMVSTGMAQADATMERARPWLDGHAQAWNEARTEACLHAEVEETWDAALYERAQWCLDDHRMQLEALLTALQRNDASVVTRSVQAIVALGMPAGCTDPDSLGRMPMAPPELRAELRALRAELWRVDALSVMGDHPAALTLARNVLTRAEAVGWPPLVARARLRLADELAEAAQLEQAEQAIEQAYFEAAEAEAIEVAFMAASELVGLLGYRLPRHDEALRWARHAELMLARLPGHGDVRRAPLLTDISTVYFAQGEYERALAMAEQVLAIYEEALGPRHPRVSDALTNLGVFHSTQGHYREARALYERALAIQEETLGPMHPEVAKIVSNLGAVALKLGETDHARALLQRALTIREAVWGPHHPEVAAALNNVAAVLYALEDYPAARHQFTRAVDILEDVLGPNHPQTASTRSNLGDVLRLLGELDGAREQLELALRAQEQALGPEHPDLAYPLQGLASIAIAQGHFDDAVAWALRALGLREAGGIGSDLVAESRFVLAKAQWEQGNDPAGALAQARRAVNEYREHGAAKAVEVGEIEGWLVEHAP